MDAERLASEDGVLDLRGVPVGPHTLIVGARDRLGEIRRIALGDGEHRRIEATLPGR